MTSSPVHDQLRKLSERCSSLQGIVINSGIGGGTGSGLTYYLGYTTENDYKKVEKSWHTIVPSPGLSGGILEPYNSILAIHEAGSLMDSVVMMDNFALHRIMRQKLGNDMSKFSNINRIVAQAIAVQTGGLRFPGPSAISLRDFHTNMVPYPRIKFLSASLAPYLTQEDAYKEVASTAAITHNLFDNSSFTVEADHRQAMLLSSCIYYKGDYSPLEMVDAVDSVRTEKLKLMPEWLLTGFKIGIDSRPRVDKPVFDLGGSWKSAIGFVNSTANASIFKRILKMSEGMYDKRSFCHHYMNQGWKMGETFRSREEVFGIVEDYKEVCRFAGQEREVSVESEDRDSGVEEE